MQLRRLSASEVKKDFLGHIPGSWQCQSAVQQSVSTCCVSGAGLDTGNVSGNSIDESQSLQTRVPVEGDRG